MHDGAAAALAGAACVGFSPARSSVERGSRHRFFSFLFSFWEMRRRRPALHSTRHGGGVAARRNISDGKFWSIMARDMANGITVNFKTKFLVVASGANSVENIPLIPGLQDFPGEAIHSSCYKAGKSYSGRNMLVVGSGNSGMEIAYDLASHGANTSIVIRSPLHIMTKELIRLGMTLAHHLPLKLVDNILVMMANFIFKDLSRHGITRPKIGPMVLKSETGRSAVIDVGNFGLIKKGIIKVSIFSRMT
ncbi:hypothetical protein BRADI_4g22715v3 [Brachypodium distachyon]|uniref:indole-3-pyruvate monooxygenase n=1 Tax=Brachypodium distachyon TaxID=15368 RepID=A0A2K2CPI7_BRADI|nr:hypothetical protein BRADI_4g22715v3 [Brachypodium distachyon]